MQAMSNEIDLKPKSFFALTNPVQNANDIKLKARLIKRLSF